VVNPIESGRKSSASAGRIAGRYELQDQLGEGGMGVVWRALDIKTGSFVAIKIMKDISDPVAVELFAKEWKALAEISHPNIVDVRDVDVIEENRQKKPFFVMPLLQGATLAELITDASARLTLGRIIEIFVQVCKGLQAAHQVGLVHRDLKPSNIFVMADDTAKIIDFGVVHLAGSKSVTGQKGTFQYMSPEQAQLREITPASDIFAMGVMLYEALTLRKPFARNTVEETMQAVIKYIPPPVSEINPTVNQSISKVVHKCLAKRPIHRFLNARDLAETLQKAYRNEPIFDEARIQPRIERTRNALKAGDEVFASEILAEIEAEGHLDPQITVLRTQIDMAVKQKNIRQLLESARARMEQDEIPLALDKIRQVLELDPENADALGMRRAMEKQRSESQIAKWLDLAGTHLSNRDFAEARHAVEEVLAIRRADTRALDLLEKIASTETAAKRIREQKEQLYNSALMARQNGEIETALSKLERLLSVARMNPEAAIPERDAVYQTFYNEVRSERDSIQSAREQAQRLLAEKKFSAALGICRDLLGKYPNDGALQALKIQIEDTERQERSAYIATVSKSVESEPDLDRRVNILREACDRYQDETQFGQQLKLVRERRDLVNSKVAKARQHEERGQYSEAISQWEILRTIHPQYPGIAFELEECKKKRNRQAQEEEKARAVEQIDGMMEARAYAKAIECAIAALLEFPGDLELAALQKLAEEGLQRTKESRRLFDEGQQALAEKDLHRATDLFRSGLKLDPRGPGLREALVSVLTESARALVEEDWRAAEPLYEEARDLDPNHATVRALRSSISEAKRQTYVGQCLTEAKALLASGDSQAALERVRTGRAEYPNDPRLEEYEARLSREENELRRREERNRDRAALGEERGALERNPDLARVKIARERSQVMRSKYPDDAEIEQTAAYIEQVAKRVEEDLSSLLRGTGTDGRPSPAQRQDTRKRGLKLADDKTKVFPKPQEEKSGARAKSISSVFEAIQRHVSEFVTPGRKWSGLRLGVLGAIVAVGIIVYIAIRWPKTQKSEQTFHSATQPRQIHMITDPSDSIVTVGSQPVRDGIVQLGVDGTAVVEVSRLGYKPNHTRLQQGSDGHIVLEPEPIHLSVQTSETNGTVEIDGQKFDLSEGSLEAPEITPDGKPHELSVVASGRRLFTIHFQARPGAPPQLSRPLDANDVFVITSLGPQATLYAGNQLKNVMLGDQKITSTAAGSGLPALTDQNRVLKYGEAAERGSYEIDTSNSPTLVIVRSVNTQAQVNVTANVDNAKLTVDGREVKPGRNGWQVRRPPGKKYDFLLTAEGYDPQEWTMELQSRQTLKETRTLVRRVIEAASSALSIVGSTPGALIEVDGKPLGEVDSTGGRQFPNFLAQGPHKLVLRNACAEGSYIFSVKPPATVKVPEIKLSSCGTLSFQGAIKNAKIQGRHVGDSAWLDFDPTLKTPVQTGEWEIRADAPGARPFNQKLNVEAGQTFPLTVNLTPLSSCLLQDPTLVAPDKEWYRLKNSSNFVYFKTGCVDVNLIFDRPKQGPGITHMFSKKRVQWVIDLTGRNGRVQYELEDLKDGQKITRRATVGDEPPEPKDLKVNAVSSKQSSSVSVRIRIEGTQVKITNDKGEILDTYDFKQTLSNARLGIKTDSYFLWSNN
jgi:serine/threonine protein kinase